MGRLGYATCNCLPDGPTQWWVCLVGKGAVFAVYFLRSYYGHIAWDELRMISGPGLAEVLCWATGPDPPIGGDTCAPLKGTAATPASRSRTVGSLLESSAACALLAVLWGACMFHTEWCAVLVWRAGARPHGAPRQS